MGNRTRITIKTSEGLNVPIYSHWGGITFAREFIESFMDYKELLPERALVQVIGNENGSLYLKEFEFSQCSGDDGGNFIIWKSDGKYMVEWEHYGNTIKAGIDEMVDILYKECEY